MGAFFAYTLYSGVYLTVLFLLYKLFVSREKQIALNRILLLSIYLISLMAYPLSSFDWLPHTELAEKMPVITGLAENYPSESGMAAEDLSSSVAAHIMLWIYTAGASAVLLRTLLSITGLILFIRRGSMIGREGYTLVVMPHEEVAPFSFGKYIVISASDYANHPIETVIAHELAHIRLRHYLDLVLAQTVCVLLWYNPLAWLLRGELKLLHEYNADDSVIAGGADIEDYQMLLIRKAAGNRFHTLVNSLSYSRLKSRIVMMQKENNCGLRRYRSLTLVLAPAIALSVTEIPAVAAGLDTVRTTSFIRESSRPAGKDPGRQVDVKMKNASGVTDVPDDEKVVLIVGNASGTTDTGGKPALAVRLNGRLLKERTEININDIGSFVKFAPDDEYPGGLWDIKLKE